MSRPKTPADWQAQIYARHSDWIAGSHIHMAVGDGWSDVVARLFDRIAEALAGEPVPTKAAIIDIKEKYAELRADLICPVGPDTQAAIDHAILLAEMRSECTCDECGREGRLRSTLGESGWLAVKCDDHRSGYPRTVAKGLPRRRVRDRRGTFEVVYDRATDTVVETPVDDVDSR
ncbi:hypothetical protein [Bosea sp. (in: a-proteobacteria)]|uniref:hypothetical protein n=1 Tax=Bosea sp. (in: a-proteobacteria) TaxID=1871050 RepID=UPI00262BA61D|nr:hypothetical protein [Bosea sp. (in: a-proteobacteria)]MCO5091707.1 hypothetical protein [Bosea sp. (in: a-proteobacteria)]